MVEFTKAFPLFYNTISDGFVVDQTDYMDVMSLNIDAEDIVEGKYELTVYFVCSNPDTNDSLHWQVETAGVPVGDAVFSVESKDVTDIIPVTYTTIRQLDNTNPIYSTLQMRKEDNNANNITIVGGGMKIQRIG